MKTNEGQPKQDANIAENALMLTGADNAAKGAIRDLPAPRR